MTRDEAKLALAEMRPNLLKAAGRILRANGVGAEDSIQEAYLKALRAIEAGNYPKEPGHLFAWFTRVVYNAAYDGLRGQLRSRDRAARYPDGEQPDSRPGPLDQLIQREDDVRIDEYLALLPTVIGKLPGKGRRAVELRFQGMTNRQIALNLDIPQGSVSALLRSAYQQLRRALDEGTAP
jgi:RNA polymerase sigma factor (sigma-70 family)